METLTKAHTRTTTEPPDKIKAVIVKDLLPKKFSWLGKVWVTLLIVLIIAGLIGYYQQLQSGLEVTAMRDYASWGIYISNFVFFVAISLVGSLITAVLRLSGAKWSTPLTRIAEMIAVSAIIFAGLIIVVDMGRPDRIFYLIIFGRLQSPIIWDVLVITTYLVVSILLLYYSLISDFSLLSKENRISKGLQKWYRKLSLNWQGNIRQKDLYAKAIKTLSILIIPLALAIHTVTAWLFATTYRPGWDSTNFGAYFVSGAFVVGAGAVVIAMYIFRKHYHLEQYITNAHFDKMGKLLVLLLVLYLYFNINEYLVPAFKMKAAEEAHLVTLFSGHYAPMFYSVLILGMILPVAVFLFKKGRQPSVMFIMGIFVVVGAWFKRYLIVTPTLLHPFLPIQGVPDSWHQYFPTMIEWSVTIGSLAGFLLLITLMARYLPVIPIVETINEKHHEQ
ncbi:MAG: NrfD/PsrC family molybdoenzyme membrane anchor subunit [Fulvivirga sp.]|nr:NrfD/PsrC family molybdoenzyme membrane anchor subunit [Fulvivirga sp.]